MRKPMTRCFVAAAVGLCVLSSPARAAPVDMNTQTCQDWLDSDDDEQQLKRLDRGLADLAQQRRRGRAVRRGRRRSTLADLLARQPTRAAAGALRRAGGEQSRRSGAVGRMDQARFRGGLTPGTPEPVPGTRITSHAHTSCAPVRMTHAHDPVPRPPHAHAQAQAHPPDTRPRGCKLVSENPASASGAHRAARCGR